MSIKKEWSVPFEFTIGNITLECMANGWSETFSRTQPNGDPGWPPEGDEYRELICGHYYNGSGEKIYLDDETAEALFARFETEIYEKEVDHNNF